MRNYVYIIEHPEGMCKIGKSTNPGERYSSIQIGTPMELNMTFVVKYLDDEGDLEAELHHEFDHARERGEWFSVDSLDVIQYIAGQRMDPSGRFVSIYDYNKVKREYNETGRSLEKCIPPVGQE